MNYNLNLGIPQGAANGLNAYGGRFSTTGQSLSVLIGSATTIPLGSSTASSNVTLSTNSITITNAGIYEVEYYLQGSVTLALGLAVGVQKNGGTVTTLSQTQAVAVGVQTIFQQRSIISLVVGDVLTLGVSASLAATLNTSSGSVNAYLSVKKLN
jgi:hypothetical protein